MGIRLFKGFDVYGEEGDEIVLPEDRGEEKGEQKGKFGGGSSEQIKNSKSNEEEVKIWIDRGETETEKGGLESLVFVHQLAGGGGGRKKL
jgi:hypothetical protein